MPNRSWIGPAMCLVLGAATMAAAENQLTPEEKKAGWKLLFDGRTYANWEDPTTKNPPGDSFTIEDGCLKATSHPRIGEDLFTKETYRNFELMFDWKISPRGNSGVKYLIQARIPLPPAQRHEKFEDMVNRILKEPRLTRSQMKDEYVVGFEYQITDNQTNPDASHNGPKHQTAALYDVFAASKDVTRPVGEFNHSMLVVKGDHLEHWLNGEKVVDASLKAPEIAEAAAHRWGTESPVYDMLAHLPRRECQISLQNHGDVAWFRNVKIRRLK